MARRPAAARSPGDAAVPAPWPAAASLDSTTAAARPASAGVPDGRRTRARTAANGTRVHRRPGHRCRGGRGRPVVLSRRSGCPAGLADRHAHRGGHADAARRLTGTERSGSDDGSAVLRRPPRVHHHPAPWAASTRASRRRSARSRSRCHRSAAFSRLPTCPSSSSPRTSTESSSRRTSHARTRRS